eukprot:scaffold111_cov142-Skeletonema_menzelii.AAC.5
MQLPNLTSLIDRFYSVTDGGSTNDICSKSPTQRILTDAANHLAVGPVQALFGGASLVVSIGFIEAQGCMRPIDPKLLETSTNAELMAIRLQRFMFSVRYATQQIVPSIVWATSPSEKIAIKYGYPTKDLLWGGPENKPAHAFLQKNRLVSLRGAIAGSVVLSQVVSLTDVLLHAKAAYSDRIVAGREPPLDEHTSDGDSSPKKGVVLRLAGEESDVTGYCMFKGGRSAVFPIFEEIQRASVQQLIRQHGYDYKVQAAADDKPSHPVFWQIDDGRYANADSWRSFAIPKSWLFDMKKNEATQSKDNEKLLVLEADATSGMSDAMSFQSVDATDLDIDLYEIAQGFHKLEQSLTDPPEHRVLRVILVDPEATVKSGGGRETKARDYISELGLADIVIDARSPLVLMLTRWLSEVTKDNQRVTSSSWRKKNDHLPVILETPNAEWFESIQAALLPYGYQIIDRDEVDKFPAVHPSQIPFIVYEQSTSNTIYTVRQYVQSGIVKADKICAFCPKYEGANDLEELGLGDIKTFCSSVLYSQLLAWVREQALEGRDYTEIQKELDTGLIDIMDSLNKTST